MKRSRLGVFLLLSLLALPLAEAAAQDPFSELVTLPPGEKYRHLSILQQLLQGVDEEFVRALHALTGAPLAPAQPLSGEDISAAANTVDRIADPQSLLRGMAQLLFTGLRSNEDVVAELQRLRHAHPVLIAAIKSQDISDEAMIIRMAITDCMEVLKTPESNTPQLIDRYQKATIVLRNDAELKAFDSQVSALTAHVLNEFGGALDAMNREIDEGSDAFNVRKASATAARLNEEGKPELEARAAAGAQSIYNAFLPVMRRQAYTW